MNKLALASTTALLLCTPVLAQGRKKSPLSAERKKLSKALIATVDGYFRARHRDTLFKKGSLTPRVVGLRPKAVATIFRGFTPKAYGRRLNPKGLVDELLAKEAQGNPPTFEGVALAFESAKIVRFNLHRDLATVESDVTLFTGTNTGNRVGFRQVWTLQKKRWVLAVRKASVPRDGWAPDLGPVPGSDWSDPGDGISGNALALEIEKAYSSGQRNDAHLDKTKVADFGRLVAVEILENHTRARVRCGHLDVALLVDKTVDVKQIPLDSRVLFRGEVHQLDMQQPWARLNYTFDGRKHYWKHIHVGLRAGEITPSE